MPCKKCDEGYKWGDKGECEYPDQEACENANAKYKKEKKEYAQVPSPVNYKSFDEYKKAYNDFHKAQELNLSAVKIELSLVSEMKSVNKELRSAIDSLEKLSDKADGQANTLFKKIQDAKDKAKEDVGKMEKAMDEMMRADKVSKGYIKEAEGAAKDLGLKPTELPNFRELTEAVADVSTIGEGAADAMDALYDIIDS